LALKSACKRCARGDGRGLWANVPFRGGQAAPYLESQSSLKTAGGKAGERSELKQNARTVHPKQKRGRESERHRVKKKKGETPGSEDGHTTKGTTKNHG